MMDKQWRSCRFMVSGLARKVQFNQATIDKLFVPFLQRMTRRQHAMGHRMIVFLAAPPGTGKSILSMLFENLSQTERGIGPIQALGINGFYYRSEYLRRNSIEREGQKVMLSSIKGAPETYDLERLLSKLIMLRQEDLRWPIYDRVSHDIVEDVVTVKKRIIIIEGNWLLLGDSGWQQLRQYADYTLFIRAKTADLKERLIQHRMRGGKSRAEAERVYEMNDRLNVLRVLTDSWPADETWQMLPDGDYVLKKQLQKVQLVNREALWQQPEVLLGDSPLLSSLSRRMASRSPEEKAAGKGAYEKGYMEGLLAARGEIIRKLYGSGMSKEHLLQAFQLSERELEQILR